MHQSSRTTGPRCAPEGGAQAELLRRVFAVEVEVRPRCGGAMRIMAFVTEPRVIRRILTHPLERRGVEARAGPWARAVREDWDALVVK